MFDVQALISKLIKASYHLVEQNNKTLSLSVAYVDDKFIITVDPLDKFDIYLNIAITSDQKLITESIQLSQAKYQEMRQKLMKFISQNMLSFSCLQVENESNIISAIENTNHMSNCYSDTDDALYYWYKDKLIENIKKHHYNLIQSIYFLTSKDVVISRIKTVIDSIHKNQSLHQCVDGKMREEKSIIRYIIYYNTDTNLYRFIKVCYNVRFSNERQKLTVKFITVYAIPSLPKQFEDAGTIVYARLRSRLTDANIIHESYNNFWEGIDMKFKDLYTDKIVEFTNEDTRNLTIQNIVERYEPLDDEAIRASINRSLEYDDKYVDRDIIFSLEETAWSGIWTNYYDYRPTTEVEDARIAKYYEKNRVVFNEWLNMKRKKNPNFVKDHEMLFKSAKDAITYGAPQRLVRCKVADLFGRDAITELPKEDPEDAILDPNINSWKL